MMMNTLRCKLCKTKGQYMHDYMRDQWTCTVCGCVVTDFWNPTSRNVNFQKNDQDEYEETRSERLFKTQNYQLMARVFPQEEKDRVCKKKIKDICYKIDAPMAIRDRALFIYEHNKKELASKIKPTNKMLLAVVVVATRSTKGFFIPMNKIRNFYMDEAKDIGRHVKEICKLIGVNQKTYAVNSIPHVVSGLMLPFKCQKELEKNYDKMCIIAPSIASETRMGVATCKLLKDHGKEIDYDYVAYLNDCTETSIKSFLDKNKKRRAPTIETSKKKLKTGKS